MSGATRVRVDIGGRNVTGDILPVLREIEVEDGVGLDCLDAVGIGRAIGLRLRLDSLCILSQCLGALADMGAERLRIVGMFGRTLADRFEIDAFGCALGESEATQSDGKADGQKEEVLVHSAQQFRLRQTRYPMSSPMAGMTCPGD